MTCWFVICTCHHSILFNFRTRKAARKQKKHTDVPCIIQRYTVFVRDEEGSV